MKSDRIIVVGAGLFGSVISRMLREQGREVFLIDGRFPGAASPAAGCVLKPGWLNFLRQAFGGTSLKQAYSILDTLYGLQKVEARIGAPWKAFQWDEALDWVPPDKILGEFADREHEEYNLPTTVEKLGNGWVLTAEEQRMQGTVIVAAGVWTSNLLPQVEVEARFGASFRFRTQMEQNRIMLITPRGMQAKAFNISDKEVWYSDAKPLRHIEDYERIEESEKQAEKRFGLIGGRSIVGARPVVPGHNEGLLKQLDSKLWVSTGGGKIGLAMAAYHASELREAL